MRRDGCEEPLELILGWASHEQARYACENWHYAGILPTGKLVKIGAWENGRLAGVIIFSRGASPFLGKKWDLDHTEICELTRIALREHCAPVSRMMKVALSMLRRSNPGLRLAVSFADPHKGHHGGVYQACGWVYTGLSGRTIEIWMDGRWQHVRGAYWKAKARGASYTQEDGTRIRVMPGKHRYVVALDPRLRSLVEERRQPYPQRAAAPKEETSLPATDGGSIPTRPLPLAN